MTKEKDEDRTEQDGLSDRTASFSCLLDRC
ncbi:unnamed protein product [Ophioblennius macclurei]